MKKQHFSLVELLVVIAIIAILAGLIIPTVGGMREKARATQAKAEMNSIKTAILAFESTYGVLPLKDTTGADIVETAGAKKGRVLSGNNGYDRIMEWLTQSDCYGVAGFDTNSPNTRKIKFLDPKPAGGSWKDPWADRGDHETNGEYVIYMDDDYDGKVTIAGNELYGKVFIYTLGTNWKNDEDGDSKKGNINNWDK